MNYSRMTAELVSLILTLISTSKCQLPWNLSLLLLILLLRILTPAIISSNDPELSFYDRLNCSITLKVIGQTASQALETFSAATP